MAVRRREDDTSKRGHGGINAPLTATEIEYMRTSIKAGQTRRAVAEALGCSIRSTWKYCPASMAPSRRSSKPKIKTYRWAYRDGDGYCVPVTLPKVSILEDA